MTEAHDPNASGTPFPDHLAPQTRLSRNEIETLCMKAARGAGLSWGLAEEAGFAAGWLAAQNVDGASALLRHLQACPAGCDAISIDNRVWHAGSGGALCPVTVGAALDDCANLDAGPCAGAVSIPALNQPVLVVPLLARMARALQAPLSLAWDGGALIMTATGEVDRAGLLALSQVAQAGLTVAPLDAAVPPVPPSDTAPMQIAPVSAATLGGLNMLSMLTTVPASDASRRGAGASAGDND